MKKLNKFFAVLVALAMMATLCVSMAFAKLSTTNDTDPYEAATITVSKIFQIPEGVASPLETFKFNIEKVTVDGNAGTDTNMPALSLDNIVIPEGTKASADNDIVKNGVITLPKLTGDVNTGFPHAGVYVYTLTEDTTDAETNTDVKYNTGSNSYDLYIYVKADGTVTPVVVDHGEKPTKGDETTPTNKKDVDPKDPTDPNADKDAEDDQLSGVNFTNKYDVIADDTEIPSDGDDETPDVASAKVTKTVTANGYGDTTKQFKYTFAIDTSNYQGTQTLNITYYKIAKDGTRTKIDNPVNDGFTLADGETFAIFGAPVGAKYTVTENLANDDAAAKNYLPKDIVTTKGAPAAVVTGTQGENLAVTNALVEDGINIAAYENTRDASTIEPEGILISNLPYIALALVAVGGLVAYVVVRRRNEDNA